MKCLKNYLVFALAVILCLAMSACGNDKVPNTLEDMVKDYDIVVDYSDFCGIWTATDDTGYSYVEIEDNGNEILFTIYNADDLAASGYLQYMRDYGYVYAYNTYDGIGYQCWISDDNILNIYSFGSFTLDAASKQNIDYSDLAGTWFFGGDITSERSIEISTNGDWTFYYLYTGDEKPTVIDYGIISYTEDNEDVFTAISEKGFDSVYQIRLTGDNGMYWDGEFDYYERLK